MGATAKGYPYPDPADPVANTDLAIKALADFLNANGFKVIHAAQVSVSVAAAITGSTAVTFPAGKFSAAPMVICQALGFSGAYTAEPTALPTATGFTLGVRRQDGTSTTATVQCHYIALQLA